MHIKQENEDAASAHRLGELVLYCPINYDASSNSDSTNALAAAAIGDGTSSSVDQCQKITVSLDSCGAEEESREEIGAAACTPDKSGRRRPSIARMDQLNVEIEATEAPEDVSTIDPSEGRDQINTSSPSRTLNIISRAPDLEAAVLRLFSSSQKDQDSPVVLSSKRDVQLISAYLATTLGLSDCTVSSSLQATVDV